MKRIKGCVNDKCEARKKKTKYEETDRICKKCGEKLSFVCDKCFTVLPDKPKKKLCIRCEAEGKDKKEHGKKVLSGIAAAIAVAFVASFLHKPSNGNKS